MCLHLAPLIGWCKITNYLDYTETKILEISELKDFHIQLNQVSLYLVQDYNYI